MKEKLLFFRCLALLSSLLSTAEQRVKIAASERRREYNEEQRNEYENYVEEDRDGKNLQLTKVEAISYNGEITLHQALISSITINQHLTPTLLQHTDQGQAFVVYFED